MVFVARLTVSKVIVILLHIVDRSAVNKTFSSARRTLPCSELEEIGSWLLLFL